MQVLQTAAEGTRDGLGFAPGELNTGDDVSLDGVKEGLIGAENGRLRSTTLPENGEPSASVFDEGKLEGNV